VWLVVPESETIPPLITVMSSTSFPESTGNGLSPGRNPKLPSTVIAIDLLPVHLVGYTTVTGKAWNAPDYFLHMLDRDQTRAFELAWRALVARTPEEVLVVEPVRRVVPAAVAGVVVDHPPGRLDLGGRMREAADHHHLRADRPGEPREAAAEADEELRVLQPTRALGERPIAGLVLGAVGDRGPG